MRELLVSLGLAWPRLLLYPGGLFALVASWLLARWLGRCSYEPVQPAAGPPPSLVDLLPPLAVLSLLPLAPARSFPFGLDLLVAGIMLLWPQRQSLLSERGRLAGGALLSGAIAMAAATGGLGLSGLLSWPATWAERLVLLAASGLWLVGVACLPEPPAGLAGRLSRLGLVLIGSLPLLGALAAASQGLLDPAIAAWLLPPLAGGCAALLTGLARRKYDHG